ncbi:pilus assembly protein PilP [Alteromonas pelagimontana]|uniref:Pilus assembly protein PilP n=1 Tax=Alteromonas pelagimontana TaxID=1858656 RepID=A0A6M4MBJ0_9ALTE|nr:pilus assembly protein PilP [Alteromonas pelagimontana]QJR80551.1 pilus assembly protein PilP [Alteromonas pelagimontana]
MKIRPIIFSLFCLGSLSACAPQTDDLVAYIAQVKQNTQVRIEPYPEFKTQPAFTYKAAKLRSPFAPPLERSEPVVVAKQANCVQPDFGRRKEALENYGLDALSLGGSFTSQGVKWVLFKSNDGSLHKAKVGSKVGLFYGTIKKITNNSVMIEQLLPDGAGCWQREETTLTMSSTAGENKNV